VATGIHVVLGGKSLNALCAIDALGVGDMYGTDISVKSCCRACGVKIRVTTAFLGRELRSQSPAGAVVWYDLAYSGSASSSCCPAIAFFCSDGHLVSWLEGQSPRRQGFRLSLAEALELGRAIFGPVLRNAERS
jgi:alkylmercury lyase